MLTKRGFIMIQELFDQGVGQKDIAARLGVHPRTVRRALRRGHAARGLWPKRGSALDAFKPRMDTLLAAGVWNAVVIWRELQAAGYAGGYTSVKNYVRPKRGQVTGDRPRFSGRIEAGRSREGYWNAAACTACDCRDSLAHHSAGQ